MSTEQEQEVIVIQEEKDGSATIELPNSRSITNRFRPKKT